MEEIADFVVGDDKACGSTDKVSHLVNPYTMKCFFNSIGMTFTDGNKGEIDVNGKPIEEIQFLKRQFAYHRELRKIVGPLSLETLVNSIQWVDCKKDTQVVLQDKIAAFQREMYLHGDVGAKYVDELEKFCEVKEVNFIRLTNSYLQHLFSEEADKAYNMYKRDYGKNFDNFTVAEHVY